MLELKFGGCYVTPYVASLRNGIAEMSVDFSYENPDDLVVALKDIGIGDCMVVDQEVCWSVDVNAGPIGKDEVVLMWLHQKRETPVTIRNSKSQAPYTYVVTCESEDVWRADPDVPAEVMTFLVDDIVDIGIIVMNDERLWEIVIKDDAKAVD